MNYLSPDWKAAGKVHDWRNYISDELKAIWDTFTDEQKRLIASNADDEANKEYWD
jgi:hypothetical protein